MNIKKQTQDTANTANTEKRCVWKVRENTANTAFLYKECGCGVAFRRGMR